MGHPVEKSPTPAAHKAAAIAIGLTAETNYRSVPDEHELRHVSSVLFEQVGRNFAFTIPLKTSILEYLDTLNPTAEAIGAVNTMTVRESNGAIVKRGFNTDWIGIRDPIKACANSGRVDLRTSSEAIIYGAGGSSRAAIYALRSLGIEPTITNRTDKKSFELAEETDIQALPYDEAAKSSYEILINCTSLGSSDYSDKSILRGGEHPNCKLIFDATYNIDGKNLLQQQAEERGIAYISGKEMLLAQGVEQFIICTDDNTLDRALISRAMQPYYFGLL